MSNEILEIESREKRVGYQETALEVKRQEVEREMAEVVKLKKSLHDQTNEAKAIIAGAEQVKVEISALRNKAQSQIEEAERHYKLRSEEAQAILKDASEVLESANEKNREADLRLSKASSQLSEAQRQAQVLTSTAEAMSSSANVQRKDVEDRLASLSAQEAAFSAKVVEFERVKSEASETLANADTAISEINAKKEGLSKDREDILELRKKLSEDKAANEGVLALIRAERLEASSELETAKGLVKQAQDIKNTYLEKEARLAEDVRQNEQKSNELAVLETVIRSADKRLKEDQAKLRQAQEALSQQVKG
jgi:hypothetical protein